MSGSESAYPFWQKMTDAAAVLAFFSGLVFLAGGALPALMTDSPWAFVSLALSAYLAADFVSGLVHFLADNFGNVETPVLGKMFVFPFREHHRDPLAITRHGFLETNGANCLISLPVIAAVLWASDARHDGMLRVWVCCFLMAIFLTNQIHKWSHQARPAWAVRFLQRCGLILSPRGHAVHHAAPHDSYFCITSGWLNPVLTYLRFFPILKFVLANSMRIFTSDSKRNRTDADYKETTCSKP